jgi:hypothetical protein
MKIENLEKAKAIINEIDDIKSKKNRTESLLLGVQENYPRDGEEDVNLDILFYRDTRGIGSLTAKYEFEYQLIIIMLKSLLKEYDLTIKELEEQLEEL